MLSQEQFDKSQVVDLTWSESQIIQHSCVGTDDVDTTYNKLLSFVHIHFERGHSLFIVKRGGRNACVVDVAEFAISLAQILQSEGNLLAAEDLAILDREQVT